MVTRRLVAPVLLAVFAAVSPLAAQEARQATGGTLRWLDKVSGETADLDISRGQSVTRGRLTIRLDECRSPADGRGAEAFAHLTIMDRLVPDPVFQGWMIASSPALSALDHARYDVWLLSCTSD